MPRIEIAALALALIVSLGVKTVAYLHPEPVEDATILPRLAARLRAEGYAARIEKGLFVTARRGDCALKVRDYPPLGSLERVYSALGAGIGPTRYAYRGKWYPSPPTRVPLILYYAQRELARISVPIERPAIVAVSASAACRLGEPRWAALPRWQS